MAEEIVVRHCSPTLAGLKIGNLFTYSYLKDNTLTAELKGWNDRLNCKGVYFVILSKTDSRALIYVYRKKYLERELSKLETISFLAENKYDSTGCTNVEDFIECLSKRLQESSEFPHEIGVFLGYPLDDIKEFIKNKGAKSKCVGYWKVYKNVNTAKKVFAKYKKCTQIYCLKHSEGYDITRLTVAV